ncbi:Cytidylate kinase-domain-containing protein [Piptocephalis cylindrospora]|uniref:(d)CMP kinase n=1 Tax=Piptocephalis cylindrospora TaxID=1907219 RepID=A0A4P9XZL7_9FUNG|nr:Cytidylate kinase-domain-containing protein [Piptocephalis cylindrospora]|eukprot:RKP11867.1 Cytidylate kinase-domain-containing protein [Piptocephalis cylindrospora]
MFLTHRVRSRTLGSARSFATSSFYRASRQAFCLAVDGPAASGKSTTTRLVAQRLGLTYIDTGGLYRAATLLAQRQHLLPKKGDAAPQELLLSSLEKATFTLRTSPSQDQGSLPVTRIYIDGEDVSHALRTPEITAHVSRLAQIPEVRQVMLYKQRTMASPSYEETTATGTNGVAMDGRDIGTTVFPNAHLKIFLSADARTRSLRRQAEWGESGSPEDLEKIYQDIVERDRQDMTRPVSPLRKADDAVEVDTSTATLIQVVDRIVQEG